MTTSTAPTPSRPRSFLMRHRILLALATLVLLTATLEGALVVASSYATSAEVTISRVGDASSLLGSATVVYHRTITDSETVHHLQQVLNHDAWYCQLFYCGRVPGCLHGSDAGRRFYVYNVRFSIHGLATQAFEAGQHCLMSEITLSITSLDTRVDPLDAAGWSATLGITPALPDLDSSP